MFHVGYLISLTHLCFVYLSPYLSVDILICLASQLQDCLINLFYFTVVLYLGLISDIVWWFCTGTRLVVMWCLQCESGWRGLLVLTLSTGHLPRWDNSLFLNMCFRHWKTYLNMSTIVISSILLKKLILIINCSICYFYFIVDKHHWFYHIFLSISKCHLHLVLLLTIAWH